MYFVKVLVTCILLSFCSVMQLSSVAARQASKIADEWLQLFTKMPGVNSARLCPLDGAAIVTPDATLFHSFSDSITEHLALPAQPSSSTTAREKISPPVFNMILASLARSRNGVLVAPLLKMVRVTLCDSMRRISAWCRVVVAFDVQFPDIIRLCRCAMSCITPQMSARTLRYWKKRLRRHSSM
jgi:hypothetical protein